MPFEVMKAPRAIKSMSELKDHLPLLTSPKLDGIRCVVRSGTAMSRAGKPIANRYIREWIEHRASMLGGFDGELTLRQSMSFREAISAVSSQDGEPDFIFNVFDDFSLWHVPLERRLKMIRGVMDTYPEICSRLHLVEHFPCTTVEELELHHAQFLDQGFEGSMVKNPQGLYRNGRCRANENLIWKVKPTERGVATVVGYERRKTPVHQRDHEGKMIGERDVVYHDEVGKMICVFDGETTTFRVGSGFTASERVALYGLDLAGRRCIVEYQWPRPRGEKPRFPTFQGWADE